MPQGLVARTLAVGGLITVLLAGMSAAVVSGVADRRASDRQHHRGFAAESAAGDLRELVIDLETGTRGYALTRERRFLEPWHDARRRLPAVRSRLVASATEDRHGAELAAGAVRMTDSYLENYSLPEVRSIGAGRSVTDRAAEGKRLVDAIRRQTARLVAHEREVHGRSDQASAADGRRRTGLTALALGLGVLVVAGGILWGVRSVLQPILRLTRAADDVRRGDLPGAVAVGGACELRQLSTTFNAMTADLARARNEACSATLALRDEVAERTAELDESRLEQLERLALVSECRDEDTHEHAQRIGRTSAMVARALNLPAGEVRRLFRAAPLHDIGKVAVPDAVLLKPGKLDESELRLMRAHTTIGAEMLGRSSSPTLQVAERIARSHHERWDGSGYPDGLAADEIPLEARIVAVADVFDALVHERPYKRAWPVADAVSEIARCSGTHFDPGIVRAFLGLDHEGLRAPLGHPVAAPPARAR